jgi:predicted Zn-ribbon and HTH transcriptional regulator
MDSVTVYTMSHNIKICKNCGNEFNIYQIINDKRIRMKNRKFCLVCNPFKVTDTKPKIKTCEKCKCEFPQRLFIDGRKYSLQRRKFCLQCSPFKKHNTRDLNRSTKKKPHTRDYLKLSQQDKDQLNNYLYISLAQRRNNRKIKLLMMFGMQCKKCGYNKNTSALHFHHRNPEEKLFELSVREVGGKSWDSILNEAKKCDVLCSNCHSEYHHPQCKAEYIEDYSI